MLVFHDGRRIQRATPQIPGEHPLPRVKTERPPPSVDYLALLRRDRERRRADATAAIRFRAAPNDDALLTLARLVERLRACCGRTLGDVEAEHAAAVLHAIAPVEVAIADTALRTGNLLTGIERPL